MKITIRPVDGGNNPVGKLAEAELSFTDGPLAGLRLIGFALWQARGGNGKNPVTFPARTYQVNGERRSFALLRLSNDQHATEEAQQRISDLIRAAYLEYDANGTHEHDASTLADDHGIGWPGRAAHAPSDLASHARAMDAERPQPEHQTQDAPACARFEF